MSLAPGLSPTWKCKYSLTCFPLVAPHGHSDSKKAGRAPASHYWIFTLPLPTYSSLLLMSATVLSMYPQCPSSPLLQPFPAHFL